MDRLLAPDGCPWDREQTLDSLRPFLVEETYEVLDALARHDVAGHCEELGDLLMQVVFHAAIRQREGAFDIDAVVDGHLRQARPPPPARVRRRQTGRRHARPGARAVGRDQGAPRRPRRASQRSACSTASRPARRSRARRSSGSRCGKVGFDWPGWEGSFDKVEEEVEEVREAIEAKSQTQMHAELGDLLLACVNLARKIDVDAENALVDATLRFQQRFEVVEDLLAERGKTPQQSNLEEMDALWNDAKRTIDARSARQKSDAFLSSRDRVEAVLDEIASPSRHPSTTYPQNRRVLPRESTRIQLTVAGH